MKLEHVLKNSDVGVKRGWVLRTVSTVIAAALLASCGGESIEEYQPERITAFGDELSVIDDSGAGAIGNGVKYTVNGVTAPYNCQENPIWIQVVAGAFGLAFQECTGPLNAAATQGRTWAEPNATVAMVTAQIDAFLTPPRSVNSKDLILLMAGMHDVLELYLQYDAAPSPALVDTLAATARQRGEQLGAQVVRITNLGAKVIVSVVPNVSYTPYAQEEAKNHAVTATDLNRQAVLSALTTAFNNGLQSKMQEVRGGGRSAGLVLADALFSNPVASGFTNGETMVCANRQLSWSSGALPDPAPLLACNASPASVEPDAYTTYLWADWLRYTPAGHGLLGSAAAARATDNPF